MSTTLTIVDANMPSEDDPRLVKLAKSLSKGYPPHVAVIAAGFSDEGFEYKADWDVFVDELTSNSQVMSLSKAMTDENVAEHSMGTDEVRAFLRSVIYTPVGQVTEESPLCQSVKKTYDNEGDIKSIEVKMIDKMAAIREENRIAGRYNDKIQIGPDDTLLSMMQKVQSDKIPKKQFNAPLPNPNTTPTE